MRIKALLLCVAASSAIFASDRQQVDFSVVSVPEETGTEFRKITTTSDYVCMPEVRRNGNAIDWFTNRVLAPLTNGTEIGCLSFRNNTTNIFIKDLFKQGGSRQRTNRAGVIDFTFSPDGKSLYFSEVRGKNTQILRTDAANGYICRQITSAANDYSPVEVPGTGQIFFARLENNGCGIWSYSLKDNFLSSYTSGQNPTPVPGEKAIVISRASAMGRSEIWKVNYETGVEECIVSDPERSFTTPMVSPDGQWVVFVGSSFLDGPGFVYPNTDIYVCRLDGTDMRQLTHHAADDISPVWSIDGGYIYFVSQRGDADATANIWRMKFIP